MKPSTFIHFQVSFPGAGFLQAGKSGKAEQRHRSQRQEILKTLDFGERQAVGAQPPLCCSFAHHFVGKMDKNGHLLLF